MVVQAAARPLWQPGQAAPAHLDGSMPGDYGFGECLPCSRSSEKTYDTAWCGKQQLETQRHSPARGGAMTLALGWDGTYGTQRHGMGADTCFAN